MNFTTAAEAIAVKVAEVLAIIDNYEVSVYVILLINCKCLFIVVLHVTFHFVFGLLPYVEYRVLSRDFIKFASLYSEIILTASRM